MAPWLPTLVALLLCLSVPALAGIFFPCHQGKARMGDGVKCKKVTLPKGLCSACPLRPANLDGSFVKCWDIFDDTVPTCLPAMKKYVEANPCDVQRGKAVAALAANPNDGKARGIVDYFLYSVCEQCCDCVPMAANAKLYPQYLASHSAANPTLYSATRGNCPAHAEYDICMVTPKVTHFTNIGDPATAKFDSWPEACPMLKKWGRSSAANDWQRNPKTTLEPLLNRFMLNMLEKLQCARRDVWDKCFALESAQDHLGTPEDPPEVLQLTPTPPTKSAPAATPAATNTPGAENNTATATPIPPPVTKNNTAPNSNSTEGVTGASTNSSRPCFPASATVQLGSGARVAMSKLQIGDEVLVAPGKFSKVYLFSHRDPTFRTTHVRVVVSSGAVLTLTPGHYLPVNGVHAPASSIVAGDVLDGVDGPVTAVSVASVVETGLYNPHTIAGTIVVENVVCSTYTTAVTPSAAQALLAPLRTLFRAGAVTEASAGDFLRRGAEGVPVPVPVL